MTTVHAVVPDGIDDPARPTGGNTYDRHVCDGLASIGWSVHEHAVPGFWRAPDGDAFRVLADVLQAIPDDSVVLLDGLIASQAPEVLVPQARRLRLVVLVHMPLDTRAEGTALAAAAAVVTTSEWGRRRLLELYALPPDRVHVARPGVAAAPLANGTPGGEALLCVAAVTRDKGHDVLVDALATLADLSWHCTCAGSLDRDPEFAQSLHRERLSFTGPLTGADLDRVYAASDLLVLPSRRETYGMVVTEALARGLPVVASDVGGVPEAVGDAGLLVPPEDPAALAAALRSWLGDADLREGLRGAARRRRDSLPGWSTTTALIADVLG